MRRCANFRDLVTIRELATVSSEKCTKRNDPCEKNDRKIEKRLPTNDVLSLSEGKLKGDISHDKRG